MTTPSEHESDPEVSPPEHSPESSHGINRAFTRLLSLSPTDMLTKRTIAEFFGVNERTIQRWVARGELPPSAFGSGSLKYWLAGHLVECLRKRFASVIDETRQRMERLLVFLLNVSL